MEGMRQAAETAVSQRPWGPQRRDFRRTHYSGSESQQKIVQHKHNGDDDDDVKLSVLGCWVDISGTNCDQCVCMVQCCFTRPQKP